jgi:serine/threonine-protein kinase
VTRFVAPDGVRRIGDRFVLGEPLGAGGMGSIYRARDERLGQDVAIKVLKRALLEDGVLRERFRREALSLAKLRHPGIVTVYDSGESDGDLYTVLELVQGETLERIIERDGSTTMLRAAPIIDQVLAALEVCHESEIVHRDIKPSNVMVTLVSGLEHIKLIDFGLARLGGSTVAKLTETGAVQGTPHYMAPEQCRGEDVGPPGDVYSAGVVFYEMLSGTQPFQGSDAATFMAQHLFVEPTPLRQVAPHVSAGVSAAVHAALAKQPHDRPTARELRDAFASAARGTDPEALAEAAAALRRRSSGLPRTERALGTTQGRSEGAGPRNVPGSFNVVVWMNSGERSGALRGCLSTAGVSCSLISVADVPELGADDIAIVVSARDGMDRVRRAREKDPKLIVVVVDVAGPDETTASIRAGASDMLLREAPDADLVAKLVKLARRRARG